MKRLLLLLLVVFSIDAAAQSQYQNMTDAQLVEQKKLAIEKRDFIAADLINKELRSRRSLEELEADFTAQKNKAAADGEFAKAGFYKQLAEDVQALYAVDEEIKAAVKEEDFLKANELQQQFKAEKARLQRATYGEPSDYFTERKEQESRDLNNLIQALEAEVPAASQESEPTPTYVAPRQQYYVSQNASTAFIVNNASIELDNINMAIENTHSFTVGQPQMFGSAANSIAHGAFVAGLSYGFNYFDYSLDFENYRSYGNTYWAKAGVGYSYNTDFGGAFAIIQSSIVNYAESTTSYTDASGLYQSFDASNTAWFPENAASLKFGTVLHPNFQNRKSDTQWGISILTEFPLIDGAEPIYSIGLSVSTYKRK